MIKKEGKYPCNARVDVDYSEKKPTIKFSYPGKIPKKDAIKQGGLFPTMLFIWIIIGVIPFGIFYYNYDILDYTYPKECNNFSINKFDARSETYFFGENMNSSSNFNLSFDKVFGFNITCDNKTSIINYNLEGNYFSSYSQTIDKETWIFFGLIIWCYLALFISVYLNRLITRILIKKKWYQRWLPKANAEGVIFKKRRKKYMIFKSKDVLEKVIVIPKFSNVELDYKTTEDFSKQLQSIKIREYKERKINMKTKKISKKKVDHFRWYAIFYFKNKPETGYLEVIYQ